MSSSLKVIFAGTPQFAAIALSSLIASPHHIVAVYTQPDRPAGRGLKLTMSPVKELAIAHHLPLYQPASLKQDAEQQMLASHEADVMIVAAYGLLLPAAVLAIPRLGCVNIHPSLLPRFRGAAPLPRTILSGDTVSGVTIMQMDAGLDTGPMLSQQHITLSPHETTQTLHDRLALMGAEQLLIDLDTLAAGKAKSITQDDALATYAHKIDKAEALLDWQNSVIDIDRKIRAFNPWPVAYVMWQGERLRIWEAMILSPTSNATAGTLIAASEEGIDIATSDGVLRLLSVQLASAKKISVRDFYHAYQHKLVIGQLFS